MDLSVFAFAIAVVALLRAWALPSRLAALQQELGRRHTDQHRLQAELHSLRDELAQLREVGLPLPFGAAPPVAEPLTPPLATHRWAPAAPVVAVASPAPSEPVAPEPASAAPELAALAALLELALPPLPAPEATAEELSLTEAATEAAAAAPISIAEPVAATATELVAEPELVAEASPSVEAVPAAASAAEPAPTPEAVAAPEPDAAPSLIATPEAEAELTPAPAEEPAAPAPAPAWVPQPVGRPTAPLPRQPAVPRRPAPRPKPVRTGPTWWERAATVLLENWTGILGAVVLVTGVGFLGIYAALRVSPQLRFLLICAFAGGLLGVRFGLRGKTFAKQLNAWLLSSAAAIFLFACVGAVSIAGLRWATPPFDYLLLLAGVLANLYLAWRTSRQEVATLHGVLSLVALAVLPPTALTLGAAAGVTAFSIAITYRQLWKYQLLLSIASFFAFHLYWHQALPTISNPLRLAAMALVLLVGGAAAVVQYRSVYARRRFEPLLFAAHLLNWTGLGINLYLYSTGSVWKTVPLALGAGLTYWAGRRAQRLGIAWLFQTDTIIALLLALATALSLQGWHATPAVIGLFMLLEALLITLVMARQREALVFRVALLTALLASAGLLGLAGLHWADGLPPLLYREALVLALAGWAGLAFVQFILKQPLLQIGSLQNKQGATTEKYSKYQSHHDLLNAFAGLTGLLQLGAGLGLARVLFGWAAAPVPALLLGLAGVGLALAAWVRAAGRAPGWLRWQQLVLAQLFVVGAGLGLHEAGLNWSGVLLLLYAESLGAVLLLAGRAGPDGLHQQVYRAALAAAALVGSAGLLRALSYVAGGAPAVLYREALVLGLAGLLTLIFVQVAFKYPLLAGVRPYLPRQQRAAVADTFSLPLVSNHEAHQRWLGGFAGLGGIWQAGVGVVLGRLLFGEAGAPVALLLSGLGALAGLWLGLATWVRTAGRAPGWVRWQQLGLAQFFVLLALVGLHKLGLNWSAVLLLLYLETLLVALLLAGRAAPDGLHQLLYRVALAEAALVGVGLLLRALVYWSTGAGTGTLYREALVVALAGWASLAFAQAAFRWPLLAGVRPYWPRRAGAAALPTPLLSNPAENRGLVNGFAGLGGGLQVLAGLLLSRLLFNEAAEASVGVVLGLLVVVAGSALGLAAWVRRAGQLPGWVRWQQLGLAQFFVVLALVGLHELGLSWSAVLLLVFVENLLLALLLAGRAEADWLHAQAYRAALAGALGVGGSLLLLVGSHLASGGLVVLCREALVLALAGWAALAFGQVALKWPRLRGVRPYLPGYAADGSAAPPLVSNHEANLHLLLSFAGLAGGLQAGVGLVLARLLFGRAGGAGALLVGALAVLAGLTLGLASWVQASGLRPQWVRRQQLGLAQLFAVLAVFGLHELGLSWPGIGGILYAESLLVALSLSGRNEDGLLRIHTYLLVGQALALPLLVRYTSPAALGAGGRAALLVGAALLTLGYQARRLHGPRAAHLALGTPLPVLGWAVGWLLLGAGCLVYGQAWAAWPLVALLGGLLYLRQRVALPGLWAGLMGAGVGYVALQWGHVLHPLALGLPPYRAGYVLLYLLPTLAVPAAGLLTSWWPARARYVRWPWLYLLGAHLVVALVAAGPAGHLAYLLLGLLALGGAAFGAALAWRRALPTADAVARAGQPDRYLLHLSYGGLLGSLLVHLWLLMHYETWLGLRADYLTAGLCCGVVAALALARPPATEPVYASWRWLHPWLPEVALLLGSLTLAHDVRVQWLPLVWVGAALLLGAATPRLALRFRRLGLYGQLYYWLAAGMASLECVLYITPSQLLSAEWWALATAVGLLFGYVGLALRQGRAPFTNLAPAGQALVRPGRYQLAAGLLYPAFLALALLLVQSFDRSVLTVLLMLQVVAVFGTSLALRRQDFRYASLAGLLGCMARLLFFDLRQSGTVARAIVFIFMGLLLLGMHALYARFKDRFTDPNAPAEPNDPAEAAADEPPPSLA